MKKAGGREWERLEHADALALGPMTALSIADLQDILSKCEREVCKYKKELKKTRMQRSSRERLKVVR